VGEHRVARGRASHGVARAESDRFESRQADFILDRIVGELVLIDRVGPELGVRVVAGEIAARGCARTEELAGALAIHRVRVDP
jgi:hypothetical protein